MALIATMPMKDTRGPEPAGAGVGGVSSLAISPADPESGVPWTGGMAAIEKHPEWTLLSRIPMRLTASVPLPHFRVSDLLNLRPGSMVMSAWPSGDDVELKIGAVQLSWSEFEVVEQRMAIRLTRLA